MRPSIRISVTIKINLAACVFALAALLKIFL
jgi:hypothetical protein